LYKEYAVEATNPEVPPRSLYVTPPAPRRPSGFWRFIKWVFVLGVVGVCLVSLFVNVILTAVKGQGISGDRISERWVSGSTAMHAPKVAVISVEEVLMGSEEAGSAGWILRQVKRAKEDSLVKAVILEVNSPGGGITASDIIHRKIADLKSSGKPVIVLMDDVAASGAYYISAPADKILAHPTTITGSIGVIIESFEADGLLQKIGVQSIVFKSAPFKDIMSPWRAPTDEEKQMLQTITDEMFGRFKDIVAKGRNMSSAEVDAVATGAIFTAKQAKENKLIDDIGYFEDAVASAEGAAGTSGCAVVRYEKPPTILDVLLSSKKSEGGDLEAELKTLIQTKKPGMYYLWPGL
jgi:protease IV